MPEVVRDPEGRTTKKVIATKKCFVCKATTRYFKSDVWTEYGNTEARCPVCDTIVYLGSFGWPDTY